MRMQDIETNNTTKRQTEAYPFKISKSLSRQVMPKDAIKENIRKIITLAVFISNFFIMVYFV
jgi:hypothetical protein